MLPFLAPAGPGNIGLPDIGILVAIVLTAMWVTREHIPVCLPYACGTALLVAGGSLAAWLALAPAAVVLVLAQDLFLLFWAAVLALGWRDPRIISAATRSWCITAPVYAAVMAGAYIVGIDAVAGVSDQDGGRAAYTFGDPNLAGSYLVVSFFVMRACRRPRNTLLRYAGCGVILLAVVFTGSNGAAIALVAGTAAGIVLKRVITEGPVAAVLMLAAFATATTLAMGYVLPGVDVDSVQQRAANSIPLLRDSVGRSDSSGDERATILREGLRLWLRGDATGYGPARTKATLSNTQAPYAKEAHNDYLATLLERGILGVIGLLVLIASIGVRCVRLCRARLPPPFDAMVPRVWLLVVIGPVMATAGLFYEVLHFRHLWAWLGIVAALDLAARRRERVPS